MKYATTTMNPDLILAFDDREYEGLQADRIIDQEYETGEDGAPPQEYTDQEERRKSEREKAEAELAGNPIEHDIEILREDGSKVGEPDNAKQNENLTGGEEVSPELVDSDEQQPQPDQATGGRRVGKPKTPAKNAE